MPSKVSSSSPSIRLATSENQEPEHETIGEAAVEVALARRERLRDEVTASRPVVVFEIHASRVVDQDADEVLLRHHGREDERGLHEAEDQEAEQRDTKPGHDATVRDRASAPGDRVGRDRARRDQSRGAEPEADGGGCPERELSLLEDEAPELEEELEQRFHPGLLPQWLMP
ncbi:MAG: hypothetical protein AMS19_06965 [Gemmatimonas sp. SG8_23]|nr:MAG: hypothetical protein AMS19_06965 [Gemmatimonas sp. SG8_23]